jgi:hypothetical protein
LNILDSKILQQVCKDALSICQYAQKQECPSITLTASDSIVFQPPDMFARLKK